MPALSEPARFILDRMEEHRRYEASDLRVFMPDASPEAIREVMHELWLNRQVERVGHTAWRRQRSSTGQEGARDPRREAPPVVKPEDLFDHDTFDGFFK